MFMAFTFCSCVYRTQMIPPGRTTIPCWYRNCWVPAEAAHIGWRGCRTESQRTWALHPVPAPPLTCSGTLFTGLPLPGPQIHFPAASLLDWRVCVPFHFFGK